MKKLLWLLLLVAPLAFAQNGVGGGYAFNKYGRPLSTATVSICTNLTPGATCTKATLYKSTSSTDEVANPINPNAVGYFQFFAAAGTYRAVISSPQLSAPIEQTIVAWNDLSGFVQTFGSQTAAGAKTWTDDQTYDHTTTTTADITTANITTANIIHFTLTDVIPVGNIPSLSAAKITSGVFDNARINFTSPGPIGDTTADTGEFTRLKVNTGLTATAGIQTAHFAATCTTAGASSTCTTTYPWPISFADTNYSVFCTLTGTVTGIPVIASIAKTATDITITQTQLGVVGSGASAVDCLGIHD